MTPQKLVSLMEILRIFAHEFVRTALHLSGSIDTLNVEDIWKDEEHRFALKSELAGLNKTCQEVDLPVTQQLVESILTSFAMFEDHAVAREFLERHHTN